MARAECLQATDRTSTQFCPAIIMLTARSVRSQLGSETSVQIPCQLLLYSSACHCLFAVQDREPPFITCHFALDISCFAILLHTQAVSVQHAACVNDQKQGRAVHQGTWSLLVPPVLTGSSCSTGCWPPPCTDLSPELPAHPAVPAPIHFTCTVCQ